MDQLTEDRIKEIAREVAAEVVAAQMPVIAETSAKRAIEMVTSEVGMSLIKKIAAVLGLLAIAGAAWLFTKGVGV